MRPAAELIAQGRARLGQSLLARNTLWMMGGQAARLVVQAFYFVVLARTLGVRGYGAFVGVVAMVAIASPFVSLGSGSLLIKNTARTPDAFSRYFGNALVMSGAIGVLLVGLVFAVSRAVLPANISASLVLCVAISDLLFAPLVDLSAQAFQAFQKLRRTAQLYLLWSGLKLVAALTLTSGFAAPTPALWGLLYLGSTLVATGLAVTMVLRELGRPTWQGGLKPGEIKEGAYFAASGAARTIYDDIDKTMLARLSTLEATGIYGAAYRIMDLAFLPVRSLLFASYPRFFAYGVRGIAPALRFAKRLILGAGAYSVVAWGLLSLAAPLLPAFLGSDYQNATEAIRWLAVLPVIKSLHYFAADTLSGSGHQGSRTAAQFLVAAFNVGINMWLIPLYSWRGAAWASIASDGLLAVTLWAIVWRLTRRQQFSLEPDSTLSPAQTAR